ncbi:hypothetical protein ARTSIC4J27_2943 [Pseudarthrobacter siccitolerans]|uniref:Uncharacterized protein n=1 Tax=Pseudarthrobacter siccitolerans TaxID=861266 RepID=A0A024H5I8_9MICC|nr:hypothetical protein ARTSIC4J27_2943 [Pseudarthrobacter siccitolerans]
MAGAVPDYVADPFQRLPPSGEGAVGRCRFVAVRRVQSDHPWKLRRAW